MMEVTRAILCISIFILPILWYEYVAVKQAELEALLYDFHQSEREMAVVGIVYCDEYIRHRAELLWVKFEDINGFVRVDCSNRRRSFLGLGLTK